MKTPLPLLFVILLTLPFGPRWGYVNAQFSLNNTNFPVAGSEFNRFLCIGGTVGNAGANQLYDFSQGMVLINDTVKYLSPLITGFASFHPGSSVATVQWGEISIIWYYSASANAYWTSGGTLIGDFGSGMTVVHANHPAPYVDTLISTDYAFGHTETEISGIRFANLTPGVDYQTISGKYIEVDGWGSLYAPLDTFPSVLRVKYTEFKYDTVFANNVPVDSKTDTLYYYRFFAPGKKHPVVVANTDALGQLKWLEIIHFPDTLFGCTDTAAQNFNPLATQNNGTCLYCSQVNYTISPDAEICPGESVSLTATGATDYMWSTGDSVSSITVVPDSSQTYSVLLSNQSYCWEIASVNITVSDEVEAGFWATNIQGDSVLFVNTSINATGYFWDFGDSTSSSEENPRHHYSSEGLKNVMLIASNSCSADTFYMSINYVGGEELQNPNLCFKVFPNPGDGKFSVSPTNIRYPVSTITVYNILGEEILNSSFVIQNSSLEIDISDKPEGIYFIQLKTGEKIYQQKIVKM